MQTNIFEEQGRCLTTALALFVGSLALFAILILSPVRPALALSLPPAAKAAPCAEERADWRAQQRTLRIGGHRSSSWWTAQARLRQCQAEYRER